MDSPKDSLRSSSEPALALLVRTPGLSKRLAFAKVGESRFEVERSETKKHGLTGKPYWSERPIVR